MISSDEITFHLIDHMIVAYSEEGPSWSWSYDTDVVSSNLDQGEVYNIMWFVSDLRQVGAFLWVLRFPPTN